MNEVALRIQRMNTAAFISDAPTAVTLVPHVRTRTAAGGYQQVAGDPRVPQVFRLIQATRGYPSTRSSQGNGTDRLQTYTLVGLYDAAIAVGDRWVDGLTGRHWEVLDLRNPNGYEVRAAVSERGD